MGRWTELVIHEKVSLAALPEAEQANILAALESEGQEIPSSNDETYLDLYTHVRRYGDKWAS